MNIPGWMSVTVYAVILMLYLGLYSWRHVEEGAERRPFALLVLLTAFTLINDMISRFYVYEGFPHWLVVATTYINFATLPAIGLLWYRYVRSVLSAEERQGARKLDVVIWAIVGIGFAALLSTPLTSMVFSFDEAGTYHRGPLFFFPAGAAFLCILLAEVYLITRVRSIGRRTLVTLLAFPVPPVVGGIIAMFVYGIPWMPLGISLSMVVLFANVQTTGLGMDYLTGAFNRRRLDEFIEEWADRAENGRTFAAVMVDIDGFKQINDTLGHSAGDIALAETARLLKRSVRNGDIVARYGGDEFFVLLDVDNEEDLAAIIERIDVEQEEVNREGRDYSIALSKGFDFFDPKRFSSVAQFEGHLDALMYADKEKHHKAAAARQGENRRRPGAE